MTRFSDDYFMKEAIRSASDSLKEREIPVGAIVVCQNRIIARAYNQVERLNDPTAHAEMIALTSAANYLGNKYLTECTLYVTLEPCVMCAGALFWAQLGALVYGAPDPGKGFTHIHKKILHPKTKVTGNVLSGNCKELLDHFFAEIRT